MKSKNILFLCQFFYPEYITSATLPYDTAKAYVEAGYNVTALCGMPKDYHTGSKVSKKEVVSGIKIKRVNYMQLTRGSFIGRLINFFSFTLAILMRLPSMKNYGHILVYSNPPILPIVAVIAKKIFGCQITYISYDVYPEIAIYTGVIKSDGLITKVMNYINKIGYKNYDNVIALSEDMKSKLLEIRPNLKEERIIVIPNWHSDSILNVVTNHQVLSFREKYHMGRKMIISYFGNMGTCQELDTILGAIELLKDENVFFLFAGHGNKMDELRDYAKQYPEDNLMVLDYLHGDEFETALVASDCFIVSLKTDVTGLAVPSKTYAYMNAAKPILAIMGEDTDVSKDITKNNLGYVIREGDISGLRDSIITLVNDVALREKMGVHSRDVFRKKYTTRICTEQYVKLMNENQEDSDV